MRQTPTNAPVIVSVIQPPCRNLMMIVTARMDSDMASPRRLTVSFLPRWGAGVFNQCRHIPSWDNEKVRKTLMEYMTTRTWTDPRVKTRIRTAATPMKRTPFWTTSRSLKCMNRFGIQESMAMLPSTRGPSMKPVWAATNRIAPSEMRMAATSQTPAGTPPGLQPPRSDVRREAFRVLPATCRTSVRR